MQTFSEQRPYLAESTDAAQQGCQARCRSQLVGQCALLLCEPKGQTKASLRLVVVWIQQAKELTFQAKMFGQEQVNAISVRPLRCWT